MSNITSLYSDKVLDHFQNPRNLGEIEDPDGVATVGNPVCGDVMKMYINVEKKNNKEYIKDIKFKTLGCGAAIATSSMATELAIGKTLEEAKELTNQTIAEALEGLPKVKMHCSNLAAEALGKAINNYRNKSSKTKPTEKQ
jgi:nitrogen fixation NifU-like protein